MKKTKTNSAAPESAESKGSVQLELCIHNPGENPKMYAADITITDRIDTRLAFNDALMSAAWGCLQEQLEFQMRAPLTRV